MKYIGIDFGLKRIGVAISDESGHFAFPHGVLSNNKQVLNEIRTLGEKNQVSIIILGESKNFKNEDNTIMPDVREFCKDLETQGFTVIMEPEMMTTIQAERIQGRIKEIDASAAALILQSYLDRIK